MNGYVATFLIVLTLLVGCCFAQEDYPYQTIITKQEEVYFTCTSDCVVHFRVIDATRDNVIEEMTVAVRAYEIHWIEPIAIPAFTFAGTLEMEYYDAPEYSLIVKTITPERSRRGHYNTRKVEIENDSE